MFFIKPYGGKQMGTIENLWRLQGHFNALNKSQEELNNIINNKRFKELEDRLNGMNKRIDALEKALNEKEKRLNKNNSILKEYDYRLKLADESLYAGNITDLKQLTFLNQERDQIKENIEKKEIEILSEFEELERLKEETLSIKEEFNDQKQEYMETIKEYRCLAKDLRARMELEKGEIEQISQTIGSKLLNKFNSLKKIKGVAVVEVVEGKCSGCNMVLPAITVDKLKNNNQILHCEYCDRILYLKK